MPRKRPSNRLSLVLASTLVCACGVVGASVLMSTDDAPRGTDELQQALGYLDRGRLGEADRLAGRIAARSDRPVPRAWLIAATARQRAGKFDQAVEAYKDYLSSCTSDHLRRYVLDQIRTCRAETRETVRPVSAAKRLTAQQRKRLAEVEDRTHVESSEHFVVRARNAALARLLVREAERILSRICRGILAGQEFPHAVDIYVWSDRAEYRRNATDAPEWSGGSFSVARVDGVVKRRIDLTQLEADGSFSITMLDRILPHEMCHVVTTEYFGDATSPLFLHEGLAMLAEITGDNARTELAGTALLGAGGISLPELLVTDRSRLENPPVFYAEAYSFTDFLHSRLSRPQFRRFLGHLKGGCTVADALQRALYVVPDQKFLARLGAAWEDHAVAQSQFLRALKGEEVLSLRDEVENSDLE